MTRAVLLLLMVSLGAGCGEKTSDTTRVPETEQGEGWLEQPAESEPVHARELYDLKSPAELLAAARDDAQRPVYVPPEVDAAWSGRVRAALRRAGVDAPVFVRCVEVKGGRLDIVEAAGPQPDVVWVSVERGQSGAAEVLAERAALYTTPIARAGFVVKKIKLAGIEAYRSNFDDKRRQTTAWVRGDLFVKVGAADVARARAVHDALASASAYGVVDSTPTFPEDPVINEDDPVIREEEIATGKPDDADSELPFADLFDAPTETIPEPAAESKTEEPSGAFASRAQARGRGDSTSQTFGAAVDEALRWLAAHQSPDGRWEAAGFGAWCDGKRRAPDSDRDGGKADFDVGVTGLALQAFLGAGYTNRGKHPHAKVVSRGLRYLRSIQDAGGFFGRPSSGKSMYNHATAALAMVEAYGMTGSRGLKGSAQRALDFIARSRNPYFAWRYGVRPGDNDTSVSAWMVMALKSAQRINKAYAKRGKRAPLTIDELAFDGLKAWLKKVTDQDYGRVGYIQSGTGPSRPKELLDRFPGEKSESMTAVGMLARTVMGEDPRTSKVIKLGAELCAELPPTWNTSNGSIDMYYWYYATLAMFQVGGKPWETWKNAMDKSMIGSQRKDTDYCKYKGSWDPVGPWGPDGGRVYSTAMLAMCLEVFYRYSREHK